MDAILAAVPIAVAAGAAGINTDTVYRWMRDGQRMPPRTRRNPQPFETVEVNGREVRKLTLVTLRDFSEAINKGFEQAEVTLVGAIRSAALVEKAWQAAAWLLERRHPDRYARPAQRVVHEGGTRNMNVSIDASAVDLSAMSNDDLEQLDALTAKAIGRAKAPPAPPMELPPGVNGHGGRDK